MCDPPHACNGKIPTLKKDLERKLQGLPNSERQREVKDQEMVLLKEPPPQKKQTKTKQLHIPSPHIFFLNYYCSLAYMCCDYSRLLFMCSVIESLTDMVRSVK